MHACTIDDRDINSKAQLTSKPIMNGGWCCSIVLLLGVLEPSGMLCKTSHLKFNLSDPFMIGFLLCSFLGTCGSKIGWSSDKLVHIRVEHPHKRHFAFSLITLSHKRLNKYLPVCWLPMGQLFSYHTLQICQFC